MRWSWSSFYTMRTSIKGTLCSTSIIIVWSCVCCLCAGRMHVGVLPCMTSIWHCLWFTFFKVNIWVFFPLACITDHWKSKHFMTIWHQVKYTWQNVKMHFPCVCLMCTILAKNIVTVHLQVNDNRRTDSAKRVHYHQICISMTWLIPLSLVTTITISF